MKNQERITLAKKGKPTRQKASRPRGSGRSGRTLHSVSGKERVQAVFEKGSPERRFRKTPFKKTGGASAQA
jgi:hypothetical protein